MTNKMNNVQRYYVLFSVIIAGIGAFPLLTLWTALDINPRDPLYYTSSYNSNYNFYINDNYNLSGDFSSENIDQAKSNATLKFDYGSYWCLVTPEGKWILER